MNTRLIKLAEVCKRAYGHVTFENEKFNSQCYVSDNILTNTVVIAFRGTEFNGKDFKTDIRAFPRFTKYGLVHTGFWKAIHSLKDELQEVVTDAKQCGKHVIVTGHSMGGSMAYLAPFLLDGVDEVVCFAPAPCLRLWKKYPIKHVTYVINGNDPVPRVRWFGMYCHYGMGIYLDFEGDDLGDSETFKVIKGVVNLKDHKIDNYIIELKRVEGL